MMISRAAAKGAPRRKKMMATLRREMTRMSLTLFLKA
jgi:hypothetical protein